MHEAATLTSVSVYTMIWLMDGMNEPLDETAILGFLNRDWDSLLKAWLKDLELYSQGLLGNALFTKDDLQEYARLRGVSSYQPEGTSHSYNVFCDVESLFKSNHIPALYQQIQRLRAVLLKYQRAKQKEDVRCQSHWWVLESINPTLATHYRHAF